jgi:pyruvate ferredoxin oxidoreductase alpha subunit/2-oxoisovalerate ferredoxin oxidoreductase alpha subunit
MTKMMDTGNTACALAVKAANVDFIAAYPITPQTTISEKLADYAAAGELTGKYLPVESEHSVMSAVTAAAAAGSRTFTATSSQGLLYMHEILHYAAGGRLPIVMVNVNRAVCAPWCLYVDHQDSVSQRDTGWIQLYCASHQEIYDTIFLAYKVAEQVHIPVMINYDGFLLSHSMLPFETLEQEVIDQFLPRYQPDWKLHPQWGGTFANVAGSAEYAYYRNTLAKDTLAAVEVIEKEAKAYEALTGRWHGGMLEVEGDEDSEVFLLSMGSMAAEMGIAAQNLREQGLKVANVRIRVYRPFPTEALRQLLPANAKLLIFDRNLAYGHQEGVLLMEARSALYGDPKQIKIAGVSLGIGGEDLPSKILTAKAQELLEVLK